jgi:V8-like Glu-specific endopeptidase
VASDARLDGTVAVHFACFGAGTPALDDFPHLDGLGVARVLAPRPFVARLPQALLRQGALAFVGHVERAWSCSFHGGEGIGRQLQAFRSAMLSLLTGRRVGWAFEYFGALYAALASELTAEFTSEGRGQAPDDDLVADLWTAHNDARAFVVLGDPAVRLAPARAATESHPGRERPAEVTTVRSPDPPPSSESPTMPIPEPTPSSGLPLDATERRFRAWDSIAGPGAGGNETTRGGPMSYGGPGYEPPSTAPPPDERRLLRERNDPERLRRLLRRRGMTDAEIERLTGKRPRSYVTLPEAEGLGDHPDLGLERILGKNDLVDAWFLEAGARAARAVGRVRIGGAHGPARGFGTGSLVGPRLLLTNHHVLPDAAAAASSSVEFGFEGGSDGRDRAGVAFLLRPEVLFLTDPANDGLDFTLVAIAPTGDGGAELEPFGWNRAMEGDDPVLVRQYVNIIQHPQGRPKQVALRDNQVIDLLDDFLHYRADTEPGSSGAPVFNDDWELVGLHHSGVPRRDPTTKRPLTRWGAPWDGRDERDIDWLANEGVRLSRILARLKAASLQGEGRRLRDAAFSSEPEVIPPVRRIPPVPEPDESQSARQVVATSESSLMSASVSCSRTLTFNVPLLVQVEVRVRLPDGTDGWS